MFSACIAGNVAEGGFGYHTKNKSRGFPCMELLIVPCSWRCRRPTTAENRLQSQAPSCRFQDTRSDSGRWFSSSTCVFAVSVMPPVVLRHSFIYHCRYIKSAIDSVVKQNSKNKTARYQAASCYRLTVDSLQHVHNFPPVSVEGLS
jgi:hypothetical protein